MKKIFARFNSKCAETGKNIRKGEEMYYDYSTRKCYHLTSMKAQSINTESAGNDFVQDPGEQYFDNFCINNNI